MVSRLGGPLLRAGGLVSCGAVGMVAWSGGLWGLLTGTGLAAIWLAALSGRAAVRPKPAARPAGPAAREDDRAAVLGLLLDAAPTPLVAVEGTVAHALNRAARRLFATDDRILPAPAALLDPGAARLRHEGRSWRLDRVAVAAAGHGVIALVDIEAEERSAEARATAELIHVLGHELLNGLAPIVSLAESSLAAADGTDRALLREILRTLARHADGLQRFATGYRALARLPEPVLRPVAIGELTADLARLFAGRWPAAALDLNVAGDLVGLLDRDQLSQALWALLQNAVEAAAPDRIAHVTLRARRIPAGLHIEVADDGGGVPADLADRIFRPFHSTKPDGTGIGLSLARQIAGAHGGTLVLDPGPPTLFRLFLPDPAGAAALSRDAGG